MRVAGAALAASIALLVFANSLSNGFVYDDRTVVLRNAALRDPWNWRTILLTPSWAPGTGAAIAYRPLSTWSLALDRAAYGDEPRGYHAVNVALHAANAALVTVFAATLGVSAAAATLAGVLFAAHPVHGEAVANVVGRAELLAALFALLALVAHRAAAVRGFPARCALATIACLALAVFAKEHALGVIAFLPLMDLLLLDRGSPRRFARALAGRRGAVYAGAAAAAIGYLALRWNALGALAGGPESIAFWMNPAAHAPAPWRVVTAFGVAARAAMLLVMPARLSADYSFRQIDVVRSLADPWALAGFGLVVAGALVLVWAWRRSPAVFVCLALTAASYVVVSNVLVPTGAIFGERFVYLPSVGACIVLAMGAAHAAALSRAVVAVGVVATLLWWSGVTWARNRIWHDPTTFAEALVREAPRSAHAHHVLGTTYAGRGLEDAALDEFERALAIDPGNVGSLFNAAVILRGRGRTDEAAARWTRATEVDPAYLLAWLNLSLLYADAGRYDEALSAADRAVALRPARADALTTRGIALRGLGRPTEARASVAAALAQRPNEPRALAELAELALEGGDRQAADAALAKLAATAPAPRAYASVVRAYEAAGRGDDAAAIIAGATVAVRTD